MKLSPIFSKYIARQFLSNFLTVLVTIGFIIFIFDFIETLRKSATRFVPFDVVLELAILKLPFLIFKLLPFLVLIAAMICFMRLSKASEIIVARSSGSSIAQIIAPVLIAVFILGLLDIFVINPISASMLARYEKIESKYWKEKRAHFALSSSGIWLREKNPENKNIIIKAVNMNQDTLDLIDVTFYKLDENNEFKERIDADKASLKNGYWALSNVRITKPNDIAQIQEELKFNTTIVKAQLQDSFQSPENISFYELPSLISNLKAAGFSALRHQLHLYKLLLNPFSLIAMIMIAVPFSFQQSRKSQSLQNISFCLITGFIIFFFSDIINAMGLSGKIPVFFSSISPIIITLSIGVIMVIKSEKSYS